MAATHNKMHEHIKEVVLRKSCDPAGARDLRDVRDVKANCLSEKKAKSYRWQQSKEQLNKSTFRYPL